MKVLFRPTYLQFDLLVAVAWVAAVVFIIVKMIKFTRTHDHKGLILTILITAFFGSFAVYLTVQIVRATAHMIYTAHRTDYQTVAGYVEDYQLTPVGAHNQESFEIDGVPFSYPPSGNTWFYHTTRDAGGVVRGNGQYLEIHYFTFTVTEGNKTKELNCIIYIAEDEEKSAIIDEGLDVPSSFRLFILETDNCRVQSLTVIEEAPNDLPQEEKEYLFSQETENGNEVVLSCEEMNGNEDSRYTLMLSLCDSDSEFLCAYTFQDVSLSSNAHIDLSNVLRGRIAVTINHKERTYTGYILQSVNATSGLGQFSG